ncbi:hypothetical protein BGX21_001623 [Mortierella sp. AD011]|nr:hypothetical protein BGX21_001623 [Mortierella sp. AD011]
MSTEKIKLFCILDGDSSAFEIKLDADDSISALKKAIKEEKSKALADIDSSDLILFQVAVSDEGIQVNLDEIDSLTPLTKGTAEISEVFGISPVKKTIHVIVQRPSGVPAILHLHLVSTTEMKVNVITLQGLSISPSSEELDAIVKKISEQFFAPGSRASDFLEKYVKGLVKLPVTTDGIRDLPRVWRRGKTPAPESRPSFLFLDLPTSAETVPDQFKSNVILNALETTESQDLVAVARHDP